MTVKMKMRKYEHFVESDALLTRLTHNLRQCTKPNWTEPNTCTLVVYKKKVEAILFELAASDVELDGRHPETVHWDWGSEERKKEPSLPVTKIFSDGLVDEFICPKCKSDIEYNDKYCHECGQKLSWDNAAD